MLARMSPVDPKRLKEIIAAIEKQYGKGGINLGDTTDKPPRIPFNSLEMNYATGGGVPVGRFSRFWGSPMAGKSLYCWQIISNAQKLGMDCVYYNIEKQYDPSFAEAHGVDTKKLLVVEGTIIEEIGTKLESLVGAAHVHVLDSISQAVSIDELTSNIEDWHRGLGPRAWGKVWRHVNERFDNKENTIIYCDQVRVNQMTGTEEPPGGKMLEHISSLTVQFKRGKWLFYNKDNVLDVTAPKVPPTLSGGTEADGLELQQKVVKSRVGRPFRQARSRLDLHTYKFDEMYELTKAAVWFGVAEKDESWYKLPGGAKVHGKPKLRAYLADHAELVEEIRKRAEASW